MQVSIHAHCLLTHVRIHSIPWNSTRLRLGFDWISMDDGWQRCNCSVRQDHGRVCKRAMAGVLSSKVHQTCYWYVDLFVTLSFWILSIIFASNTSSEWKFAQHSPDQLPFSHHALQLVLLIEYRTWIQACPSVMAICALGGTAPGTTIKANPWCGKIASQTCAFVRSLHHHSTPLMTATCNLSTAQDLFACPCLSEQPWCLWKRGCEPIICKRLWIVPMSQCDSVWLILDQLRKKLVDYGHSRQLKVGTYLNTCICSLLTVWFYENMFGAYDL